MDADQRSSSVSANYIHTNLSGLPDFGVPYNTVAGAPVTSVGVPRDTYYGFVNRDFQNAQQDIGTLIGEFRVNDYLLCDQQVPGRAIGAQLHRNDSRAGHRQGWQL